MQRIGHVVLGRIAVYCLLAVIGGELFGAVYAQDAAFSEDEVKAAFLYHFGTYVQWPETSAEPVTIGVLGAAGVAAQLDVFLPNRTIQGRPVEARRLATLTDLDGVEMLFIGPEHNDELEELIAAVGDQPVLTVTDAEQGLDRGAIVNFQLVDDRVRFEISVPASERVGLMLSSRLLSAALRVRTSWCAFGCHENRLLETLNALLRALLHREPVPT